MKQITPEQAAKLATSNKARLKSETYYCQEDWVRANAPYIAAIETGRYDRTLCGEWPKGWKAEMKKAAKQMAEKALLERFLRDECKLLDGAIWLGNWQMIEALEKPGKIAKPPCPRCGHCGFIEDAEMNLAGVCSECKGAGCTTPD